VPAETELISAPAVGAVADTDAMDACMPTPATRDDRVTTIFTASIGDGEDDAVARRRHLDMGVDANHVTGRSEQRPARVRG